MLSRPFLIPSILSADFADLASDVQLLLADCLAGKVGGDIIHVDVMDGHLVPNISFGPPVIARLRATLPSVYFDAHLMIDEPVRYAGALVKAGVNSITFHAEAPEVRGDLAGAIAALRALEVDVGITIKPGTPVDAILPVIGLVDLVLVMSVEPGFGGQSFMPEQLAKCRQIKPLLTAGQRLEIDGGINVKTIGAARAAGVDWFVVGNALFDAASRPDAIALMCGAIRDADAAKRG